MSQIAYYLSYNNLWYNTDMIRVPNLICILILQYKLRSWKEKQLSYAKGSCSNPVHYVYYYLLLFFLIRHSHLKDVQELLKNNSNILIK